MLAASNLIAIIECSFVSLKNLKFEKNDDANERSRSAKFMKGGAGMNWNTWLSPMAKRGLVLALMLVAVAAYYVKMLKGFPAPVVVPDEFGYSVIAAYLAGHDWSNVAQGLPWYSYGYSLLPICGTSSAS